eukprot:823171_1
MKSFLVILLWYTSTIKLCIVGGDGNFVCVTRKSSMSGTYDDAPASIGCTSSYPILVSCGYSCDHPTEDDVDGGFISNNICYARNANGAVGVYAHARCCNFAPVNDVYCTSIEMSTDSTGDDNPRSASCAQNGREYLLGCT